MDQHIQLFETLNLTPVKELQSLWSGYGHIIRCSDNQTNKSVILKLITHAPQASHPRGWASNTGHMRKLESYRVESEFYKQYAKQTDEKCKVPAVLKFHHTSNITAIVLEDLVDSGFSEKLQSAQQHSLFTAIRWLAYFHGKFFNQSTEELWPQGGYWHLETRQDEYQVMPSGELKTAASNLDNALKQSKFSTLLHDDAKFDNLCFRPSLDSIAAVDFQYAGKGVGVVDLAYLAGSCLNEQQLFELDGQLLDYYLEHLELALTHYRKNVDVKSLITEYRKLYPIAWADFYRFLIGWNPESWKINAYMQQKTEQALSLL